MAANPAIDPTVRIHTSVLAAAEKRLLIRIASRLPRWVTSDQLTALGAAAMAGVGLTFALGDSQPFAAVLVVVLLGVNWFGDSLDGTLARVRAEERPRYGFYLDHVLDAAGMAALTLGLIAGGLMSPIAGLALLGAYYLLMVEIALATHALGAFRLSFWHVGPTELRILLAAGAFAAVRSPIVHIAGWNARLFDAGAAVAVVCLLVTFVLSAVTNTRELSRREPRHGLHGRTGTA
jgi:phosphatidylglycerophosphate synthase